MKSLFQQRHYEHVAWAMSKSIPPVEAAVARAQWLEDCRRLADMFDLDNPKFHRPMFMAACMRKMP